MADMTDPLGRETEGAGFGRGTEGITDPYDPFGIGVPMPTGTGVFDEVPWRPGIRMVLNPRTGELVEYSGPGIIRSDGTIETGNDGNALLEYDLLNAPRQLYFNLEPAKLSSILDTLKTKGASVNTPEQAIGALQDLLTYSNVIGRDYETTLRELDRIAPDVQEKAPRYRVSSSQDLGAVFDEAFKSTIGRGPTKEERDRAINSYRSAEIGVQSAKSGVVESVASPAVFGVQAAREAAPTEARAFDYLNRMDRVFQKAARRVV